MKQFAGLTLVAASLLAGCVAGTDTGPEVLTQRAEQVDMWTDGELASPVQASISGQVSFTGVVVDQSVSFMGVGAGVTGKMTAAADMDAQTIAVRLSNFHSPTGPMDGAVDILVNPNGTSAMGGYDGKAITTADFNGDYKEGVDTGISMMTGAVELFDSNYSSAFTGTFRAYANPK